MKAKSIAKTVIGFKICDVLLLRTAECFNTKFPYRKYKEDAIFQIVELRLPLCKKKESKPFTISGLIVVGLLHYAEVVRAL